MLRQRPHSERITVVCGYDWACHYVNVCLIGVSLVCLHFGWFLSSAVNSLVAVGLML